MGHAEHRMSVLIYSGRLGIRPRVAEQNCSQDNGSWHAWHEFVAVPIYKGNLGPSPKRCGATLQPGQWLFACMALIRSCARLGGKPSAQGLWSNFAARTTTLGMYGGFRSVSGPRSHTLRAK